MQGKATALLRAMLVALAVTAVAAAPAASAGDFPASAAAKAKKKCGKKKGKRAGAAAKKKKKCTKRPAAPLPDLKLSPEIFNFGTVALGTSPEHSFTVRNFGTATAGKPALKIDDRSTAMGSPTPAPTMTISANNCTAGIPADGSCAITVKFNPVLPGVQGSAILTVSSNPGGSLNAAISGRS